MTKNILVFGAYGMLGHSLALNLGRKLNANIYCTVRTPLSDVSNKMEAAGIRIIHGVNAELIDEWFEKVVDMSFDIAINCIGLIKQLPSANDPVKAHQLNAQFPHDLAAHCRKAGIRLIHVSTDCVFSGKKGNYIETDQSDAEDLYGRTKYLGELHDDHCMTLRTSIIGHELKTRYGLVEWFLSQTGTIKGFTKAIYTGFPTIEIARIIAEYIMPNKELKGLYHVSSESINKYELLKLIAAEYGKRIEIVPDDSFVCDRSLNSDRFKKATGYKPPSWVAMIEGMHEDYLRNKNIYG